MAINHYVVGVSNAHELADRLNHDQILELAYAEYKKRIFSLISRHEANGLTQPEVQKKIDEFRPFAPRRTEEQKLAARVAAMPKEARERFLENLKTLEARV